MKHGRIVDSAFRPHPLLRSAHAQTIYASLIRPQPALSLRTERLTLADGDFVDLGFAGEGTGPRVVLFLQRGAGGEPNLLPQSYHHGASHDLREVLAVLKRREPQTPLYAIGWSLGGTVLLKCLGD